MKQRRFLRIEIFGLTVTYDTSPECDALALRIVYGKHDAIEESVVKPSPVTLHSNVCLDHLIWLEPLRAQVPDERLTPRSISEHPFLGYRATEPARPQIRSSRSSIV